MNNLFSIVADVFVFPFLLILCCLPFCLHVQLNVNIECMHIAHCQWMAKSNWKFMWNMDQLRKRFPLCCSSDAFIDWNGKISKIEIATQSILFEQETKLINEIPAKQQQQKEKQNEMQIECNERARARQKICFISK